MISQEIPKNNTQAKKTWLISECVSHIVTVAKNTNSEKHPMDSKQMIENCDLSDWAVVMNWYALNTTYAPKFVKENHLPIIKAQLHQIRF